VIFVTIGSLFPFDRLIRVMDGLAPAWPDETFIAQIGRGTYEPQNMQFARLLAAKTFIEHVKSSKLIVAHAGMGSVLSAMECKRPIVILPRIMELGEHTTDHQMATARWLSSKEGIYVAMNDSDLKAMIDRALSAPATQEAIPATAPAPFLQKIRSFIGGTG
jgi:UDP-N-acetylglucosamine transferase subunit ALG13